MRLRLYAAATALICLGAAPVHGSQDKPPDKLPSIADKTQGLQKLDGFMPLYWQAPTGRLFMATGRCKQELLYQVSLPAGLGFNPVGLDRGQLGASASVFFDRVGQKVLVTQP